MPSVTIRCSQSGCPSETSIDLNGDDEGAPYDFLLFDWGVSYEPREDGRVAFLCERHARYHSPRVVASEDAASSGRGGRPEPPEQRGDDRGELPGAGS